jgi:PAS domain S-box-containing protein
MLPDFRIRQRDYLLEISRAITEELDLEKVLHLILRVATELLAGHAGLVALRQEGGWQIASHYGISRTLLQYLDPLLADIPDQNDPARFELPEVNRRLQRIAQAASMGLMTGVALPMIARQEVVGVIFVFRSWGGVFSSQDRSLLQGFAAQAAIAVHNARLYTDVSRQQQNLAAVLESSADGIFILNPQHEFVRFNRACARLTGVPSEEALGRPHAEIIHWERRAPGLNLEEAEAGGWPLSTQASLYVEGDLRTASGSAVSVGITYAPASGPDGHLLGIVGNVRDITRFREAEELKSTFISVVSHELRTPVALIKGYVGTLRREDAQWDPDVVRDALAVIEEESDRLSHLIDDLLDASRLQAGGLPLQRTEVALDQLARRLAERFQAQSQKHSFTCDFPSDFPVIIADEARVTQVLDNLLSNAIKYAPAGGQVTVEGRARPDDVTVCVSDEGPGIDPEDLPHVFDRFYRASRSARKAKGAGLGLYLARSIVEAHGGRIWADDRASRGARICFSLPRSPHPSRHD